MIITFCKKIQNKTKRYLILYIEKLLFKLIDKILNWQNLFIFLAKLHFILKF